MRHDQVPDPVPVVPHADRHHLDEAAVSDLHLVVAELHAGVRVLPATPHEEPVVEEDDGQVLAPHPGELQQIVEQAAQTLRVLVDDLQAAGINSGLMMPQYTAASLVLENQTLATPDSIRSLPTSAGQEDHNANAMTAARHTYEIIENLRQILSIEIYTAIRAIELRNRISDGKLGEGTKSVYEKIRKVVTYKESDTLWGQEILKINEMLKDQKL